MSERNHNFVGSCRSFDVVSLHGPDGQGFEPLSEKVIFLFSIPVQIGPWTRSAFHQNGHQWPFPKSNRSGCDFYHPLHLAPMLRVRIAISLLPLCVFYVMSPADLHLYLYIYLFNFLSFRSMIKNLFRTENQFFFNIRYTFCFPFSRLLHFTATHPLYPTEKCHWISEWHDRLTLEFCWRRNSSVSRI
jgi:hypothetical protein